MRRTLYCVAALAVAALMAGPAAAHGSPTRVKSARLIYHPASRTLDARLDAQLRNLAHARYVCHHGRGYGRQWNCAASRWLAREVAETRHSIQQRSLRRANADWLTAVDLADQFFPGTGAWLRSCSRPESEGGWGRWVPNSRGSGAGGWLQFLADTFDRNVDRAFREARAAGLVVPPVFRSWYSRVGQALTGASMLLHGQRGEWSGSGC